MVRMRLPLVASLVAFGLACGGLGDPHRGRDAAVDVGEVIGLDASDDSLDNPCGERWTGFGGGPATLVSCDGDGELRLCGAPMVLRPTEHGFLINALLAGGDPAQLTARVRPVGAPEWQAPLAAEMPAADLAQWNVEGLLPGVRYQYELRGPSRDGKAPLLYSGSAVSQRRAGQPFVFALMSDSHIGPDWAFTNQGDWCTLATVAKAAGAIAPDFVLNLGDMLDFHQFGFNDPPPESVYSRRAYRNYRVLLGDLLGNAAHFPVIGNWEGEDGWFTAGELALSRQQRLLYMPGPLPTTYPQSGSPAEDYYAFTWGDALFVVLNVMSYTPTPHLLSVGAGAPDDWTLGSAQLEWLTNTLASATAKWRFLFIHHPVGGAAGDAEDSAYGRGGGRAAHVGEQAKVHQLMRDYGVQIFFYGHDHVFTDMAVDGIHYSEPGSAGAIWLFSSDLTGYQQSWRESGWARVAVSPAAVEVKFLSTTGDVVYQYQLQ